MTAGRQQLSASEALYWALAAYAALIIIRFLVLAHGLMPDSYGLWSFARFVLTHRPADIYDPGRLLTFQTSLGLQASAWYPFGYPPPMLLLLAPFGLLPYALATASWTLLTFALCLVAVFAGRSRMPPLAGVLLLAPSTAIAMIFGQTGFLFAAVLVGGMRLGERRPWLGGAVLGLLICKPQLALLVPLALLASGRWQSLLAMMLSAACLMALSAALFGPALCLAWPHAVIAYAGLFRDGSAAHWALMPTVMVTLLWLGASNHVALAAQAVAGIVAASLTWRSYRLGQPSALAVLTGMTFLATPYAFIYDLPLMTAGLVASLACPARRLPPPRLGLLTVFLVGPMLMLPGLPVGLASVVAGLLLARPAWGRAEIPDSFYPAATIG